MKGRQIGKVNGRPVREPVLHIDSVLVPSLDILQNAVDYCIAKGLRELEKAFDSEDIDVKIRAFDAIIKAAKYVEYRKVNIKNNESIEIDMENLKIINEDDEQTTENI